MNHKTTHKTRGARSRLALTLSAIISTTYATGVWAESNMHMGTMMNGMTVGNMSKSMMGGHHAGGRAPVGLMGKHMHKKGEWMLSYRFMQMGMSGNINGTDNISADTIATTIPNPYFGMGSQPPTLRIVPTEMVSNMHMFGAMYAPSDDFNLMAMIGYFD
ncbi:MAG: hypothetical protein IME92_04245, partial [Proteobacteria bacterium]|nr:hypothetical protein [Pseudomonadota bacterium]